MKWFEGTILEAIQRSKNSRSLFVVYISGDDNDSLRLAQSFDAEDVTQAFLNANCTAVKLHINSETGVQFSQIYPVVLVPCVFFIGENGVPLEVSGGFLPPNELILKLSKALQLSKQTIPQGQHIPVAQVVEVQSVDVEAGASASASLHVSHGVTDTPNTGDNSSNLSIEEKQKRKDNAVKTSKEAENANELLAKKREEKMKEEKEKEKLAELERRKLGHGVAKLKQFKEDQERKEFENSYKKEKEDERLAREKVRADIERDRLERSLRYQKEKSDKETFVAKQQAEKEAAAAQAEVRQNAIKMESARIQFRMPDASTVAHVFASSDSLAAVRTFIMERMPSTCRSVTLSTIYPKRTFTDADFTLSLLQLELAPSAVIVVVPKVGTHANSRDGNSSSGILAPLWWLGAQLLLLWTIICNFLFAAPVAQPQPQPVLHQDRQSSAQHQTQPLRSNAELRSRQSRPDSVKRHVDGNIHRLTADDSDDESATWNGNSTQQM